MLSKHFATVSKGKIVIVGWGYPPHELTENQIPLSFDEYIFLTGISETKGIDLTRVKRMIRDIERKMKNGKQQS